mmetsp:Transcript_39262/g.92436  ORF Transcript_39262/g.92436 Transcript_39262/m.92436 type:complete len:131 (+) Transcript_39262:85-477(+)
MARLAVIACLVAVAGSVAVQKPAPKAPLADEGTVMRLGAHNFVDVKLGPFDDAGAACDYCFSSFTKEGIPPAGPVAPMCTCMAYQGDGGWTMFCSTPASAAGYVAEKGGCTCKARDMEHMAATTCEPIEA